MRGRVWTGGRPEPVRPIAGAAFADGLAAGDLVRLRIGLRHRLTAGGDQLALELPDREITLPGCRPRRPCGRSWTASDTGWATCRAWMQADQLTLVRRLLREGVLVPDTGS